MARVLLAVVLVGLAVLVAWWVQRRRPVPSHAPTFRVPDALDRDSFERPDAPWLVAVFTSSTCDTCALVSEKARALASDAVVVQELEAKRDRAVHDRYGVDAVPLLVIADQTGAVRAHFFGPVSAADMWSTLADLRES
jgi:hypothetical protein